MPSPTDPIRYFTKVCRGINRLNSCRIYHSLNRLSDSANVKDQQQEISITRDDAYCLLQLCESKNDLHYVRRVQGLMVYNGLESLAVLSDHLVRLYAYHGSLPLANEAFEKILSPSSYTWVAIISAHAKLGQDYNLANGLYHCMQLSDANNDKYIFLAVLKGCMAIQSLSHIRIVHNQIMGSRSANLVVGNALVDGYAKCGSLEEAERAFNGLQVRDIISWNALLAGYVQQGRTNLASQCFEKMQAEGMRTDQVSWTTIIAGFAQHGEGNLALSFFQKMQQEDITPNNLTFTSTVKACTSIKAIEHGRIVHGQVIQRNMQLDLILGNTLVDMYAKCGSLPEASKLFDKLLRRDLISWNAMIAGYADNGEGHLALDCLEKMQRHNREPDEVTFLTILNCINGLPQGRLIHENVMHSGVDLDAMGSKLIETYATCGSLEELNTVRVLQPLNALKLCKQKV